MYIDVPETGNIDLIFDDKKVLTKDGVASAALKTFTDAVLVFTVESNGHFRIASTGLGTMFDAVGDQVIIRGSDDAGVANNDGVYTVLVTSANYIEVAEPVVAATSDANAQADEFDTFILHPTKRTGQICVSIVVGANPATLDVSFVPGGYWASKIETGLPAYQGEGLATTEQYLIQIETAPYLQTEEADLGDDNIEQKGTILMRLFPKKSEALTVNVDVNLVQLA